MQNDLFDVGADLCTPLAAPYQTAAAAGQEQWVDELEAACDRYNEPLAKLRSFVLPGGTPGAAQLHVARTVARRAERSTWAAIEAYGTGPTRRQPADRDLPQPALGPAVHPGPLRQPSERPSGDVLWQPGGGR